MRLANGELVRIRTGELEEHIVADVAWAAVCYLDWTGDAAFAAGPGRELLVETARYWASRVRYGRDGRAHIYGVIGQDEYHEPVDDNAFTNVIARWNLRRAALVDGIEEHERAAWLSVADALVDGYDRASGIYEQLPASSNLEPLVIGEIAPRRQADWKLDELVDDPFAPRVSSALDEWRALVEGPVRLAHETYSWQREPRASGEGT